MAGVMRVWGYPGGQKGKMQGTSYSWSVRPGVCKGGFEGIKQVGSSEGC